MEIWPLNNRRHFTKAEELQRQTWGCTDLDILPSHLLQAASQNGSCLLGGFLDDILVGMVYGFPGSRGDESYLYIHLVAVHRDYQKRGYGHILMQAQADWARAHGFQRIVWTFDPLQTVNARLYIAKLGTTCQHYLLDYYGDLDDDLNRGVPSDRLEVDWWLDGRPRLTPSLAVNLPRNVLREDRLHWRMELRRQFIEAFANGLTICDFELRPDQAVYWLGR